MLQKAIALLCVLFLIPAFAVAALLPTFGSLLEIAVTPEHPRPGDAVTLTVSDPSGTAGITAYMWLVNGEIVDQGIGHTSISIVAGALGNAATVRVVAIENGSPRGEAVTIIRPASVDIIWEGDTYTPPLYIGRPLASGEGAVRLMAIPHLPLGGAEVAASRVVYSWKLNGVPVAKQSGYGKSSITIFPPRFGTGFSVSVRASTQDGTVVAENVARIEPQAPSLLVYEDTPLLGMRFDRALSGVFPFLEDEVSFVLYPIFVSNLRDASYTWNLDGTPFAVDAAKPRAATFRKVGGGSGVHTVSVSFENAKRFLERGESSFELSF